MTPETPEEARDCEDIPIWICHSCGELVESEIHCPYCGTEPPWGCDCGQHGDTDVEMDFDDPDYIDDLS